MAIEMKTITTDGQFDARKARQLLYEWARDNSVVNQSANLASHLGLSGEETYLLMAVHLLSANEGLMAYVQDEIATRIPTFHVQATQSGPFATKNQGFGK